MNLYYVITIGLIGLLIGGAVVYFIFPVYINPADVNNVDVCEATTTIEVIEKEVEVEKITKRPGRYQDFYDNNDPKIAYVIEDGKYKRAGAQYSNEQSECAKLHDRSLC